MAFSQRLDSGPGTGSATVDLSTADATWDVATVQLPRALFVEGAGTVKFTALDGTTDSWLVPAGAYIDVTITRVWKTGTTGGLVIHAIY